MIFEKDYELQASSEQLIAFVNDVESAVTCIPNLERHERLSETKLLLVVRPQFSFLKARLTMEWEIVSIGPKGGVLHLTGKGIGSSFEAKVNLTVTKIKKGTLAHLQIDISPGGLLKQIPKSVIIGAAGTLADEMMVRADEKCSGTKP